MMLKDHRLVPDARFEAIRAERRPVLDRDGRAVDGLSNAWIWLNNPAQLNSYDRGVARADSRVPRRLERSRGGGGRLHRRRRSRVLQADAQSAPSARRAAASARQHAPLQRSRHRDPDLRQAGHQPRERDADQWRPGNRHGVRFLDRLGPGDVRPGRPAPRVCARRRLDRLPAPVRRRRAGGGELHAVRTWSAYKATGWGLLNLVVTVLELDGAPVANPAVVTNRWIDDRGAIVYGDLLTGAALADARARMKSGRIDLARSTPPSRISRQAALHDARVSDQDHRGVRKKLEHWQRNAESNRAWLALNMMTEAKAGFRAFNDGPRTPRSGLHRAAPPPGARRDLGRRAVPEDSPGARRAGREPDVTTAPLVRVDAGTDGWVRLVLDRPPGNILTIALCDELTATLATVAGPARSSCRSKARGRTSATRQRRGARADRVGQMLPAFYRVISSLLATPCPTAAIVRGRCLGGGLEVALACDLVFAAPTPASASPSDARRVPARRGGAHCAAHRRVAGEPGGPRGATRCPPRGGTQRASSP